MMARFTLKDIAKPQRWTARKLALETGLAYNTVWGIWTNKSRRADLDTLDKLANALGIKPQELIDESAPGLRRMYVNGQHHLAKLLTQTLCGVPCGPSSVTKAGAVGCVECTRIAALLTDGLA
jgi:DNA-binding Xre family transcriptional regulator